MFLNITITSVDSCIFPLVKTVIFTSAYISPTLSFLSKPRSANTMSPERSVLSKPKCSVIYLSLAYPLYAFDINDTDP